ncbi:MAG TPA: TonB-dependent receptor [Gemmatimonadaceae bacterium]|nr:TonB-dependent receptor [Gemmatimonadaceae bacterium]
MKRTLSLLAAFAAAAPVSPLRAQDSTVTTIAPVRVTVSRDAARSTFDLPHAVTRLDIDADRSGTRRANLTELLLYVPGMSVMHRYNPTQDPRMSVRGFGARSAFGIRGVRVLRDGIPLTLADGQTAVDFLDLETIGAAEIFRGSAGALYGNSSGGVVDFRSEAPPDSGGAWRLGSFVADRISRFSGRAAFTRGGTGMQGTVTRNAGSGPRDYSDFGSTSALGDVRWTGWGGTRFQTQLSWYDAPDAQNPGALTATEMAADPTAADPTNILRKAGKSVQQTLLSLQGTREGERGAVSASLFGGLRDLANPQSFAIIEFDRMMYGASVHGQTRVGGSARAVRLAAGADLLGQSDDRQNYANCAGREPPNRPPATCPTASDRGAITVDQEEGVTGLGVYLRGEVSPLEQLSVMAALRSDRTRFSVDNRLDPTNEGTRTMSAVTPMAGVNWRVAPLLSVYANVSSSFETPTTTELANQPDGSGGLNTELEPQRGLTYEVGIKGIYAGRLGYDVALFTVDTKDELIPFEIPGGGGRRYFRNAGRTTRHGAEVGVSGTAGVVALGATATWIQYLYDEYAVAGTNFAGNRVPGVAPAAVSAYAALRPRWGSVALEAQHVAKLPTDDANLNYADAYTLLHLRAALALPGRFGVEPMAGIENFFDETYAANIVANAANGRFFEPGPGRVFYVGLRVNGGR